MDDVKKMTDKQIEHELQAIRKFVDEATLIGDPGPYEKAADRENALLDEQTRRGVTTPRLSHMLRFS